jgi:hypothetical protein
MSATKNGARLPRYRGKRWIRDGLPKSGRKWLAGRHQPIDDDDGSHRSIDRALARTVADASWKWPDRPIYFLADPHADTQAFNASLVASGGVRKTGPGDCDIKLTSAGRKGTFIIGGDCLDKGPSNLRLLHAVRNFMDTGARIKLLAGNHDVRLLMGLRAMVLKRDPRTEHLFVRMGPKVVPLLKEVHAQYLDGKKALRGIPGKQKCRHKLYPSPKWFDEFPRQAAGRLSQQHIQREITRMRAKVDTFEDACREAGLSLREVYAAALKCRELFLEHRGEFAWFFRDMQLAYREGSFLFIHAGLDDSITRLIKRKGVHHLNRLYQEQVQNDLFDFYYGPLANTMRTKYRDVDMSWTRHGARMAHRQGLYAVVHGHRNRTNGQRIMLRKGMIHFEGDITMDRNSRRKEGLKGYGAGVIIVRPQGQVIGISTDYPYAKVFEPANYSKRQKQAHAPK